LPCQHPLAVFWAPDKVNLKVVLCVAAESISSHNATSSTLRFAQRRGFESPQRTINKEFTEFFYDPERTRLKGWHIFLFFVIAVLGLVLAAALIAALAQLNQNP
ncbi:MAG: hypothetical protein WA553_04240, partial [Methylocella sp.]